MRSRGPISADERHSYDEEEIGARPAASSDERVGGIGERKREIDRGARGQQARAHSGTDSHPEGQYRTPLHRGPAPCKMLRRLDALAAHVAAVAHVRSPSLAAAAARGAAPSPPRLSLLLSLSLSAAPLSPAQAPPLLQHWHMLPGTCVARAQTHA